MPKRIVDVGRARRTSHLAVAALDYAAPQEVEAEYYLIQPIDTGS